MGRTTRRRHEPCRSQQFVLLFADRMLRNLGALIHRFEQLMRAIFLRSSLISTTASAENSESLRLNTSRPSELWGSSEMVGTFRKWSYALAHAHSLKFELDFKTK